MSDPDLDQASPISFGGFVNRKKPVTVTWELLEDDSGPRRILVDVDAPLRPFGSDPTPPRGTPLPSQLGGSKALANGIDDETEDNVLLPVTGDGPPEEQPK